MSDDNTEEGEMVFCDNSESGRWCIPQCWTDIGGNGNPGNLFIDILFALLVDWWYGVWYLDRNIGGADYQAASGSGWHLAGRCKGS